MASAKLLAPDAVKVENEIDSTEMEPLTKGVLLTYYSLTPYRFFGTDQLSIPAGLVRLFLAQYFAD